MMGRASTHEGNFLHRAQVTLKMYYISIVSLLKLHGGFKKTIEIYRKKQLEYNTKQSEIYQKQELSKSEASKFMEWDEILNLKLQIEEAVNNQNTFLDYLVYCLYTELPPMRLDYGELQIVNELPNNAKGNFYINNQHPQIVLTEYKTAHRYGKHIIDIPHELSEIIKLYIEIFEPKFLIESRGKPLTPSSLNYKLTNLFKKFTDKPISVNILRHSYISYHKKGTPTINEANELASSMGHSVGMSEIYRRI